MADKTITITAAPRKRAPQPQQAREVRHGAFTRIDDEPIGVSAPPVLLVGVFTEALEFALLAYDISTPASPKSPKAVAIPVFLGMTARAKTVSFSSAMGYGFTYDGFSPKLEAINLSKPRAPVSIGSAALSDFNQVAVVEEALVYWVNTDSHAYAVADVTDPLSFSELRFPYNFFPFGSQQFEPGRMIAALNRRLYVANFDFGALTGGGGFPADNNNFLATYSFDNPAVPVVLNTVMLEDITTSGSALYPLSSPAQVPPVVLGDGVIYVGYCYHDNPIDDAYTSKIKTFSLAAPDAPAEVNSVNVNTGTRQTVRPVNRLYVNKAKTRLFAQTYNASFDSSDLMGELKMYDISTPASPVLLDSISLQFPSGLAGRAMYVADTFIYLGIVEPAPAISVYSVASGVFQLLNTVDVPTFAGRVLLALDKKGFPL